MGHDGHAVTLFYRIYIDLDMYALLCCLLLTCSCGGELSLVPLVGLLHGQVLTGGHAQQVVVVGLVEGLMEMLQMV